ncbi:MAG: proton-conducting transporter membrane subunit [Eubacteriales bacterium]|nr:proton-conducting transporter membrane subunit [Eubacteriales bacterium]
MMQHYPILAIMTYFLGAFLIVIFGKNRTVRNAVGFLATAVPLCLLITLVKPVMMGGDIIAYWMGSRVPAGGYAIGIALEVDALSLFFGLLVATAVFAAMLYSFSYMSHDDNEPQYYTLFLMLCGGVMGLVLSGDLFNMFIMVEILTFAAVALTAFRNTVFGALEAAFKYLVVGSIGSSCILAGTIMLYAQAHTLNFAQLSAMIPGNLNLATTVAYALLFIGFCTKAFLVPFHPLAADAHGAAPAPVSVLISGVLTKSGLYGIIRLTYILFRTMNLGTVQFWLVFLGSVSMFVCVTMALAQHDFKRLLAFHSISQIGYVLTAAGLATALGVSAGLYHAMNHTLFKGLLFLCAGAVLHETGTTDLDKLGGLSKKMPHTTVLFLVGAFSISGIPPFNGFASKWLIYQAAYQKGVESGNIGFLLVTICCLVTSTLTLASFVKVTQSVFFGQLPKEYENVREVSFGMRLAMGLLALLCIVTGLFPGLVTTFLTEPAARAVFGANHYINAMMGAGYAESFGLADALPVSFYSAGVWSPISWLCLLMIMLLAVAIVAVSSKYDQVSALAKTAAAAEAAAAAGPRYGSGSLAEGKYELFFGGEESVYSQVGGDDMFWGFKHNWRHYFSFMHNLHSGIVNDYALWAVIALALAMLYAMIIL